MDFINIKKIGLQEFHSLKSEWQLLLSGSKADCYFFTYDWLSVWAKHFKASSEPYILIARGAESGDLLGTIPLAIETTHNQIGLPIKKLSLMGNGSTEVDHLDFIIKKGFEAEVSKAFVGYLQKQKGHWDILFLDGLANSSLAFKTLVENFHTKQVLTYTESCPYLSLPESWESLRQTLGKNMRYNLGRYKRKLEKAYSGKIEFKLVESIETLNEVLPKLYSYHHFLQQAKNGESGIFEDDHVADFHTELSKVAMRSDQLRLYYLSIDSQIVAVLYCFKYKDSVLFYQAAYDLNWKKYSPGRLLLAYVIEASIAEGAMEFDFLRGDESYKSSWTSDSRIETRIYVAGSTRGYITLLPQLMREKIKSLLSTGVGLTFVRFINPKLAERISL